MIKQFLIYATADYTDDKTALNMSRFIFFSLKLREILIDERITVCTVVCMDPLWIYLPLAHAAANVFIYLY